MIDAFVAPFAFLVGSVEVEIVFQLLGSWECPLRFVTRFTLGRMVLVFECREKVPGCTQTFRPVQAERPTEYPDSNQCQDNAEQKRERANCKSIDVDNVEIGTDQYQCDATWR